MSEIALKVVEFTLTASIGLVPAYCLCLLFATHLFGWMMAPLVTTIQHLDLGPLRAITQVEQFSLIYLKVPLLAAVFVVSPWLAYQAWRFMVPGLHKRERRWAKPVMFSAPGLFILGGIFGYFVLPTLLPTYLISIAADDVGPVPMITVSSYFDMFVSVVLASGVMFQIPVLIFFLMLLLSRRCSSCGKRIYDAFYEASDGSQYCIKCAARLPLKSASARRQKLAYRQLAFEPNEESKASKLSEIDDTATSTTSGRFSGVAHSLLSWVAPGILLVATFLTAFPAYGLAFACATLIAYGGHAVGHYVWARRYGVASHLPFFVPAVGLIGTVGVFTKMRWPMTDRRALIRIFTGGPIAGFCVSWIVFLVGLTTSKVAEVPTEGLLLWDSLLTYFSQLLVFGHLPETQTVELSPIAFAGWCGLMFNSWHLLPIGRLDAGRVVYALWGRRVARWVSVICAIGLVGLFPNTLGGACTGGTALLTLIRIRRQHPHEQLTEALDPWTRRMVWCAAGIMLISLIPG